MPSFTMQMTPELQKAADRVRAKLGVRSVADAIRQLIEDADHARSAAPKAETKGASLPPAAQTRTLAEPRPDPWAEIQRRARAQGDGKARRK